MRVGKLSAVRARRRLHEIEQRPENRRQRHGNAELIRAQQEKRIGGIPKREQQNNHEVAPRISRSMHPPPAAIGGFAWRIASRNVAHHDDRERESRSPQESPTARTRSASRARHSARDAARIQRADTVKLEDEIRHQRTQHRAGVVRRGVKPECQSPRFGRQRNRRAEHRAAMCECPSRPGR